MPAPRRHLFTAAPAFAVTSERDNRPRHAAPPGASRPDERPRRQPATVAPSRSPATPIAPPSVTLAGLRLLLGYSWLAAGIDKLLLGTFPAGLAPLLLGTLRGGAIPGWFAALLRAIVLPHGVLFGVLVETGESLAGLGLIAAGLADLAPPLERRLPAPLARWVARWRRIIAALAVAATIATVFVGLSYYLLDGAPFQGFMPNIAFDGAISPPLLLALGAVASLAEPLRAWLARRLAARRWRAEALRQIGIHGR